MTETEQKALGLLRPKEMAFELGISERTLQEWTKARHIPHIRIGGVKLYDCQDCCDVLKKRFRIAPSQAKL